jgi:hypothetical protein
MVAMLWWDGGDSLQGGGEVSEVKVPILKPVSMWVGSASPGRYVSSGLARDRAFPYSYAHT